HGVLAAGIVVEQVDPGDFLLSDELLQLFAFAVGADADNLEAELVILLVGGLDVGDFGAAGWAPSGPEIDKHDLALVGCEIEVLTGQRLADNLQLFADQLAIAASGAGLLQHL